MVFTPSVPSLSSSMSSVSSSESSFLGGESVNNNASSTPSTSVNLSDQDILSQSVKEVLTHWMQEMREARVPACDIAIIEEAIQECAEGADYLNLIFEDGQGGLAEFDQRITHLPDIFDFPEFEHIKYIRIENFPGLTALPSSMKEFEKVKEIKIIGCPAINSISNAFLTNNLNNTFIMNNPSLEVMHVSSNSMLEISASLYTT